MNEPLFALRYTRTAEHIREAYRFLFFKRPRSVAVLCLNVLLIALCLTEAILFRDWFFLVLGAIALALPGKRIWNYFRTLRTIAQRQQELITDGPRETDLQIYDDRLSIRDDSGSAETALENVGRIYRTAHLILVETRGKLMYLLPRDAFVKGTPEDCVRFFAGKGIKVV